MVLVRPPVHFHGTDAERAELLTVFARNCSCLFGPAGETIAPCPPHMAMLTDQRFMDGLLWDRHLARQLIIEEMTNT